MDVQKDANMKNSSKLRTVRMRSPKIEPFVGIHPLVLAGLNNTGFARTLFSRNLLIVTQK
jgi:hypothetical protein